LPAVLQMVLEGFEDHCFQTDTPLVSYTWNLPVNPGLITITVLSVVLERFD